MYCNRSIFNAIFSGRIVNTVVSIEPIRIMKKIELLREIGKVNRMFIIEGRTGKTRRCDVGDAKGYMIY